MDRPAVALCGGDRTGDGDFQSTGGDAAVAALVDGGVDTEVSPLCSSLSLTACFLGNKGAMSIAKACCRKQLEELCLENCGIGNAGAAALALALEEGAIVGCTATPGTTAPRNGSLRKLVLSGNRIGGIVACARALRNIITQTRCRLEVLDISDCAVMDNDVSVICRGLEDARCRLRVLRLSGNVDLSDRGANALAEALRTRSHDAVADTPPLQLELQGCSINTWGCEALAASVLDVHDGVGGGDIAPSLLTLSLQHNCIKDLGVEMMSCATLGQEYKEQRKRQGLTRRRQHPQSSSRVTPLSPTRETKKGNGYQSEHNGYQTERNVYHSERNVYHSERNVYQSKRSRTEHLMVCQSEVGSNLAEVGHLPPLVGTPLYVAAAAALSEKRRAKNLAKETPPKMTTCVLLDGNRMSVGVVAGQGALAGLGETALFRGCVLPETIVANKEWTRGAFWNKGGQMGRNTRREYGGQ